MELSDWHSPCLSFKWNFEGSNKPLWLLNMRVVPSFIFVEWDYDLLISDSRSRVYPIIKVNKTAITKTAACKSDSGYQNFIVMGQWYVNPLLTPGIHTCSNFLLIKTFVECNCHNLFVAKALTWEHFLRLILRQAKLKHEVGVREGNTKPWGEAGIVF